MLTIFNGIGDDLIPFSFVKAKSRTHLDFQSQGQRLEAKIIFDGFYMKWKKFDLNALTFAVQVLSE